MNLQLLLENARARNLQRDAEDRAGGDRCPSDGDVSELLLTAIEALEAGTTDENWDAVGEGLVMLHEVLARLAEAADPMPMRPRREVDLARQLLGPVMMVQRGTFFRGAHAALCWVTRHHPTDEAFADLLGKRGELAALLTKGEKP